MQTRSANNLRLFALAMLITGAIDSIRNLPATALFGSTLIFFFIFAAIVFLIPIALISAELASAWTEHGGVYNWAKLAFGKKIGFLAIWLQWINTMVWYPTILSFIAGTLSYLINPALAQNKLYLVSIILSVFWIMTLINLKGLKASARFASFCAVIGMLIPMILIITLAAFWVISGKPIEITFNIHTLLPSMHHTQSWISLTAIMAAYLGMELASVHINHVQNPQKTFPRALFLSVSIILVTMILGSLAIAFVVPHGQINLVDGIMQAFHNFFMAYHLEWIMPIVTVLILIGSLGGMINWIISPAKGLLQAARDSFLPEFFTRQNKHGVAANLLITQAILVSVMCLAFLLMPTVNASYWLLTDLSTQLYMFMYVIIFIAAIYLRYKFPNQKRTFKIPGGNPGIWAVGLLGLIGCAITLTIGFFPPASINVGGIFHYELVFILGMIVMIIPIFLFFKYQKRSIH